MKKFFYLFLLTLTLLAYPSLAQEENEDESSALKNHSQVQKAENLASESQKLSAEEVLEAQENVDTAQEEYDTAKSALDSDLENVALQEALDEAESKLEDAKESLANASGTSLESINEMRDSGMGWGEIAHELGIHPSVLGLGHNKKNMKEERVRNTKSFETKNAGYKNENGNNQGLKGKGNSSNSSSKENSSASSKGNSNGNKGGNGKGSGKK